MHLTLHAPEASQQTGYTEIIVRKTDPADSMLHTQFGAEVGDRAPEMGLELWQVPDAAVDAVLSGAHPGIAMAEINGRVEVSGVQTTDSYAHAQWNLDSDQNVDIDWSEAQGYQTQETVTVGVIDSGIDLTHEDLNANIWVNSDEIAGNGIDDDNNGFVDDIHGWDFHNGDNDASDDHGHGTHVAGTIGAESDNGEGVAGVASDVTMMALKVVGADGYGSYFNVARALNYAIEEGAKLSNISWGGGHDSQALREAVANAEDAGHLVVAAAGNQGSNNDYKPIYPASYENPNVISVAATTNSGGLASFSNYGSHSVDLAAPGQGILSTLPEDQYGYMSGTSMATPHVAAAAAQIWSVHPTLTFGEVRDAILDTVERLSALDGKTATGGQLNLANALASLDFSVEAHDDTIEAIEETPIEIDVLANDTDADGDALTLTAHNDAGHGTVTVKQVDGGADLLVYTPDENFIGTDTFTYTASDGNGGSSTATVTATVINGDQDVPVAEGESVLVATDGATTIDVLANDHDPDGDPLSVIAVEGAAKGTVTINADGTLAYTPVEGAGGQDSFTYTLSDGQGNEAQARVEVTISDGLRFADGDFSGYAGQHQSGGASTAAHGTEVTLTGNTWQKAGFAYEVTQNTVLTFEARVTSEGEAHGLGVEGDVSWGNGNDLTFLIAGTDSAATTHHALNNDHLTSADGTWKTFQIDLGQHMTGDVSHLVFNNDDDVAGSTAEASYRNIQFEEVEGGINLAPTAEDDYAATEADDPVTLDVLANDSDPEGDPLTLVELGEAESGTVIQNADGTLTYTADAGYSGQDSFTYTVDDGNGNTDQARVTIDVSAGGETPTAEPLTFVDSDFSGYAGQHRSGGADARDGGSTVTLTGNTWQKAAFDYTVTENTVLTFEARVTSEGEAHGLGIEGDTSWGNGNDLTFLIAGTDSPYTTHHALNIDHLTSADGTWKTFQIDLGQHMTGDVSHLVFNNDDDVAGSTAEASYRNITFTEGAPEPAPNAAPEALADSARTTAGETITIDVLANDSDPDGDSLSVTSLGTASNGTATLNADGTVNYTAEEGFTGEASFTYTVADGLGGSDTAAVTVTVDPAETTTEPTTEPNTDPIAFDASNFSGYAGQHRSGGINLFDEGRTVNITGNTWQTADLDYTVTSETVLTFEAKITQEGEAHGIGVEADSTWGNGNDLTFLIAGTDAAGATHDALNIDHLAPADGSWKTFTIDLGEHYSGDISKLIFNNDHDVAGADAEAYYRNVTLSEGAPAELPNTAPDAVNDSVAATSGQSVILDLLANDTDPEGHSLEITGLGTPTHGTVTLNTDGTVSYAADAGFTGTANFDYTITDSAGAKDSASVTVEVSAPAAPEALNFANATFQGYAGQHRSGGAEAIDDGTVVHVQGNTWQTAEVDYTLTEDTVLTFEARITQEGEAHGIGVETDSTWGNGNDLTFLIAGTDSPESTHHALNNDHLESADGTWKTFQINIGEYITGDFSKLIFNNDHDVAGADAEAYYRDITFSEGAPSASVNLVGTSHDDDPAIVFA